MKYSIIFNILALLSFNAFADVVHFNCELQEGQYGVKVEFAVSDLDSDHPTFVNTTPSEVVKVSSVGTNLKASALNHNSQLKKVTTTVERGQEVEALELQGDDGSGTEVRLGLLKNSNYTRGYFQLIGERRGYQVIGCTRD